MRLQRETGNLLFSFVVSQAFAKGMAFEELGALSGHDIRNVEFDVLKANVGCRCLLPDFKDFDPAKETLTMLKPIHELKDAPRAWRKNLHQVLVQWLSRRKSYPEPEFYCVHGDDEVTNKQVYQRALEHTEEQSETCNYRNIQLQAYTIGNLQCLFSVPSDDIKGTASRDTAGSLLKRLHDKVGQCKADCNSFLHAGIQHEYSSIVLFTHQCVYINGITPIDVGLFTGKVEEAERDTQLHGACRSVPGAVASIAPTRAELAVYVQAFRRRAHVPRIKDCTRLNIVIQ